jgi:hypothetical protein
MQLVSPPVVSEVEQSQVLLTDEFIHIATGATITGHDLVSRPDLYDGEYVWEAEPQNMGNYKLRCSLSSWRKAPTLICDIPENKRLLRVPLGFPHLLHRIAKIKPHAWVELLVTSVASVAEAEALTIAERASLAAVIAQKADTEQSLVLDLIKERMAR